MIKRIRALVGRFRSGEKYLSLIVFLALVTILGLVGRAYLVKELDRLHERRELVVEFLNKLILFAESHGEDMEAYTWLVRHSTRLQLESGLHGIMAMYRPPYENIAYRNYQIFLNFVGELRRWLDDIYSRETAYQFYLIMHDALHRYHADLEGQWERLYEKAGNPLECVVAGISFVLSTPLRIFAWMGLVSAGMVVRISRSHALQVLGKLIFYSPLSVQL